MSGGTGSNYGVPQMAAAGGVRYAMSLLGLYGDATTAGYREMERLIRQRYPMASASQAQAIIRRARDAVDLANHINARGGQYRLPQAQLKYRDPGATAVAHQVVVYYTDPSGQLGRRVVEVVAAGILTADEATAAAENDVITGGLFGSLGTNINYQPVGNAVILASVLLAVHRVQP